MMNDYWSGQIFKALHTAYRQSVANPFLKLNVVAESQSDHATLLLAGSQKWKGFRRRVDDVGRAVGAVVPPTSG